MRSGYHELVLRHQALKGGGELRQQWNLKEGAQRQRHIAQCKG